jgi:hypothetical protein
MMLPSAIRALALAGAVSALTCGSAPRGQPAAPAQPAVDGMLYAAGSDFVAQYCAGCHWSGGENPDQTRAHHVLPLDTYADWRAGATVITAVLDKWHLDGRIMPPDNAPAHPSDDLRRAILDWISRGSPNTPDGH